MPSAFTCTITPFDESGVLDTAAMTGLCERLVDAGMGGYIGSASPGEGHALTLAETETLYGTAVDVMKGRAPVRGQGIEMRTADQYQPLVRIAEAVGMDAMQLYSIDCGHANKPNEPELERYFRQLLDAMTIPAVISSHHFGGYVVSPELADRLLTDYEHLIGFNVTTNDLMYLTRFVDTVDGRAEVHVGGAMQALTILALGGDGFLCTDGNVIPKVCMRVISGFEAGDVEGMHAAYRTVMRFFALNRWPGGSMRFLKAATRHLGLPGGYLREPFCELETGDVASLAHDLEQLGVTELL